MNLFMAKTDLVNAPYYDKYIQLIAGDDLRAAFALQSATMNSFLGSLAEAKGDHAYAPGKWTVKQLIQHLIDAERVFAYRAVRFARRDSTPLAGFEEDDYAAVANVKERSIADLTAEFHCVRDSTEKLFASFTTDDLRQSGIASNHAISVTSLGWVILGHYEHHKQILMERYL